LYAAVLNFGVVDAIDVGGRVAVFGIASGSIADGGRARRTAIVLPHFLVEGGIVPRPSGTLATSYICSDSSLRSTLMSNSSPFVVNPLDLGRLQQLVEE
jgi:hypothetical protein